MKSTRSRVLTYTDLELYTEGFHKKNFIGKFQFGRVYRGKIPHGFDGVEAQDVTVKIWETPERCSYFVPEQNLIRLKDEVFLLQHKTLEFHTHLVKLIGYCSEGGHMGVVYDLNPQDTLSNLIPKGDFNWLNRIKVALQFACLLEFFHAPMQPYRPYMVRNVDAAHIMLDQEGNVKLFDFSMISGGIFPDRRNACTIQTLGCRGYIDPAYTIGASWTEKSDVYAFGIILLGLISKRVYDPEKSPDVTCNPLLNKWAESEYKPNKSILGFRKSKNKCSLVHHNFEEDQAYYSIDGPKITDLAMQCVDFWHMDRPTMKQVVDCLLNLHVVRHHADTLGVGKLVRGRSSNVHRVNLLKVMQQLICNAGIY